MDLLIALGAGLAVGLVVGMFGAGGGILAVPTLVYVLDVAPTDAAAASLIIVGLTALVSIVPRLANVAWREGLIFACLGIAGSVVGSRLSTGINPSLLLLLFGALLLGVSIFMIAKARSPKAPVPHDSLALTIVTASITGLLTGLFGVGGGFMIVPALVVAMGFGMKRAVPTSLLIMIIMSAVGLVSRLGADISYDLPVIGVFALASMAATLVGERLTRRVADKKLKMSFGIMIGLIGLVMIALNVSVL